MSNKIRNNEGRDYDECLAHLRATSDKFSLPSLLKGGV